VAAVACFFLAITNVLWMRKRSLDANGTYMELAHQHHQHHCHWQMRCYICSVELALHWLTRV
jgi:hypothetical protein